MLERIDPDSPDAEAIKRAIDRLEEIAVEITRVEDLLTEANFKFWQNRDIARRPFQMLTRNINGSATSPARKEVRAVITPYAARKRAEQRLRLTSPAVALAA